MGDVPEARVPEMVKLMFDRGYGYIGMSPFPSSDEGDDAYGQLDTDHIAATLDAIKLGWTAITDPDARRLQAVTDAEEYEWSCDATLFHCRPVCMRTTGTTTMVVSDSLCEGVATDPCGCQCLFDAAWTCDGDKVVCTAQDTATLQRTRVGDMVCSSRGAEMPPRAGFSEAVLGECDAQYVPAGDYPSVQCMRTYEESLAQRKDANTISGIPAGLPEDVLIHEYTIDSFALPAAFAVLAALYA